jgi:hypothetical protein
MKIVELKSTIFEVKKKSPGGICSRMVMIMERVNKLEDGRMKIAPLQAER